jgi:hypothetical protein
MFWQQLMLQKWRLQLNLLRHQNFGVQQLRYSLQHLLQIYQWTIQQLLLPLVHRQHLQM